MICPLCRRQKARRACPALSQDICAVCCGTKRIVEIACPETCVYLQAAQRHPAAVVRRQQEVDLLALMTALGRVSEPQLQLFFLMQSVIARFKPEGFVRLLDDDVAEATGALASTLETAGRGVLYEHRATSVVADALRRELTTLVDEVGRGGGSRFEREAAEVLRGIERGARHDTPGIGAGPQDYLSLVGRVLQERPRPTSESSSIVLP